MKKVYHTPAQSVNCSIYVPPTVKSLSRYGQNLPLRLCSYDFDKYRPLIEKSVSEYNKQKYGDPFKESHDRRKRSGGRPPLDLMLMFKVVLLGVLTRLSDNELAFRILDSDSYRLFLGVEPGFTIARQTIWKYREIFIKSDAVRKVFDEHLRELQDTELMSSDGPLLVDGSFVEAPKQRNSKEVNDKIKRGVLPEWIWPGEENKNKRRHKDVDASWTMKGKERHYGYKLNVFVDSLSKLIVWGYTSTAKMHDSQALDELLHPDDQGRTLYGDSAYIGKSNEELVEAYGLKHEFCERGTRGHPLSESQKIANRIKSATRCRVEHVFAFIEMSMGGSFVRSVGLKRAEGYQWLTMFCYNLCRQNYLQRTVA